MKILFPFLVVLTLAGFVAAAEIALSPKAASLLAPIQPAGPTAVAATTMPGAKVVGTSQPQLGGKINLTWTASPDASVTGYLIYLGGVSGTYTNAVPVSNVTNVILSNLGEGRKYFFAATATNAVGTESAMSNEAIGYTSAKTTIGIERFVVSSAGVFGLTNDLFVSTNLAATNWTKVLTFTGNGSPVKYLHTNNNVGAYFKVIPR